MTPRLLGYMRRHDVAETFTTRETEATQCAIARQIFGLSDEQSQRLGFEEPHFGLWDFGLLKVWLYPAGCVK